MRDREGGEGGRDRGREVRRDSEGQRGTGKEEGGREAEEGGSATRI